MGIAIKGHKLLGALLFGACLLVSASSNAHWHGHGWGWGPGWGGFYYSTPAFYNCGWVGGFWRHGYWVPRHRACW